jgi:protein N-terminal amidase
MCLSGYEFTSSSEIKPFLEDPHTGPAARLCQTLAKALQCHVIAGYPEIAGGGGGEEKDGKVGYNSAILVAPSGEVIGNARATFTFGPADGKWAMEGTW